MVGSATTTRGDGRPAAAAAAREVRHDLLFEHDRPRAPGDGAVGDPAGQRQHPWLQRGEEHRRRRGAGHRELPRAVIVSPWTSTAPSRSRGSSAARYSRMCRAGTVVGEPVGAFDRHPVREAKPEHESAVGRGVGGERLRRQCHRVAGIRRDDRRAQLHATGLAPGEREHGERVEPRALREPHRCETLLGRGDDPRHGLVERCGTPWWGRTRRCAWVGSSFPRSRRVAGLTR